jgi:hypothetical protein
LRQSSDHALSSEEVEDVLRKKIRNQIIVITLSEKIPARIKYDYPANIGKIQLREILKSNVSPEISHLIEDKKRGSVSI